MPFQTCILFVVVVGLHGAQKETFSRAFTLLFYIQWCKWGPNTVSQKKRQKTW